MDVCRQDIDLPIRIPWGDVLNLDLGMAVRPFFPEFRSRTEPEPVANLVYYSIWLQQQFRAIV
jgi:hypothetical protein